MRLVVLSSPSLDDFQLAALRKVTELPGVELAGACIDARPRPSAMTLLKGHLDRGRGGYVLVLAAERLRGRFSSDDADARAHFQRLGVPATEVTDLYADETLDFIRGHAPDCIVRLGFGIIREPVLSLAPQGVLSYHHGDLRRYRGLPPGFWELYNGEREMGVTLQVLAAELDAGRVVEEIKVPIRPTDGLRALEARAYEASQGMLRDGVAALAAGRRPAEVPAGELAPLYTYPNLRQWLALKLKVARRRLVRLAHTRGEGPPPPARARVLHLGPEASGQGGMGSSLQLVIDSPVAERFPMEAIPTWRSSTGSTKRALIFASALVAYVRWSLGPGTRIVHVHTAVRGSWYRKAVCVVVARLLRRPVVLQFHVGPGDIVEFADRIGPVRHAVLSAAFRSADRVVSVSRAGADEVERRYGLRNIVVVTNPVPEVDWSAGVERNGRSSGTPSEVLYIGGFYDPAKGADVLMEALPGVLERFPETRVRLAGPGEPTAAAERVLRERAQVRWEGWLETEATRRAIAGADVFVLSSVSEGMPNAILEAMAYGAPIVSTTVGGVPEILTDRRDALLVPPGEPGALAEAICELLGDPEARARLGAAARERAERINRDEVWARLDALYEELVAGP